MRETKVSFLFSVKKDFIVQKDFVIYKVVLSDNIKMHVQDSI
jgi:hypothetical protein